MDKNLHQNAKAPMIALIHTQALKGRPDLKHEFNHRAPRTILLILTLLALAATATAQEVTIDNVKYALWSDGTASVEPSPNASGTLNLRGTITYENITYTLTRISDNAFYGLTTISGSLTIPNTVTEIGNYAFWECNFTGALTLPTALQHIGNYAFWKCNFTGALNLPDGLLTIGNGAFYQCEGFTGQFNLPATLTSIGEFAFDHCRGFSGTLTLPPLLTEIAQHTFYGIPFTGDFIIPDGITAIDDYAFVVNRFSSIDVGDGVATIGNYAFSGSIASQLTLGRNVTSVGEKAFQCGIDGTPSIYIECKSTIPPTLGADVFKDYRIGWGSITVPCGAKDNYLDSVYGWNSNGASVLSVMEAESQDVCIDGVYYRLVCSGHTATVMNSAFLESSQGASYSGDVVIPATVEYGGITYSVTHIAQYAFYFCQSVTSVTLGSNVQSIGDDAFGWCTGLGRIVCQGTTPPTMTTFGDAFFHVNQNITLYVPCGALASYQGSEWDVSRISMVEGSMVEMDGLHYQILCGSTTATVIQHASYATTLVGEFAVPYGFTYGETYYEVTAIGDHAFEGCTGITELYLNENMAAIGSEAFKNCTGLTKITSMPLVPPTAAANAFCGVPTDIPVEVAFCSQYDYSVATGWSGFNNFQGTGPCEHTFIGMEDNLWSNPNNWMGGLPDGISRVGINGYCEIDDDVEVGSITIGNFYLEDEGDIIIDLLTVKAGKTLTANDFIYTSGEARHFVIEDGAQVIHPNAGAKATMQKTVSAYSTQSGVNNGWHLMALPLTGSIDVDSVGNLIEGEYDLYGYDESTAYWKNSKNTENSFTALEATKGYLYGNSAEVTLEFSGTLQHSSDTISVPLSYTNVAHLKGFNLVGNPFPCNAYLDRAYYVLGENGTGINPEAIQGNVPIPPCTAVFVKAEAEGETVVFTRAVP